MLVNGEDQQLRTREIHFLSLREFFIWMIVVGVTVVVGFMARGSNWGGDIGNFVNSINTVASMFALGFPIFLLTGLMFASPSSRRYFQQLSNQGFSNRRFLLFRFVQCLVLVCIYAVVTTIIIFTEPVISASSLGYSISLDYFYYLPAVLIASLIVGCILAAFATLLTLAIDNVFLSASLGSATTIIIALVTGWTAHLLNNSLTRNLATSSPHTFVKVLAAVLTGHDFLIERRDMMYFGLNVSFESVIISLVGYTLLASAAIMLSLPILSVNTARWRILAMIDPSTIWETSIAPHNPRVVEITKGKFRFQKGIAVFFVSLLLVSFSLGNVVISQNIEESSTIINYQSPEGGESIVLGTWLVFEFEVSPLYPGFYNNLRYEILVVDWGSCPDELSYTHGLLKMEESEFNQLNESSKLELCRTPRNETKGEWGGVHVSWGGFEEVGTHIMVFHVYATTNSTLTGALQVSIEISQRPR